MNIDFAAHTVPSEIPDHAALVQDDKHWFSDWA